MDSLIPGSIVLIEESEYSHGFTSANTRFYRIWPQTGLLLSTSTFIYTCSEEEQFRFVRLTKPDTLLIARFFKRKCDPEWHSQLEKGPEKILQIFRFDAANNRYEEWKPKDNRIWKAAMKAFGPLLEGEDLEKLKGQ